MPASGGLYVITDCENLTDKDLLYKTEKLLNVGVSLFQYRNKDVDRNKNRALALKLQFLCQKYQTPFIINDDLMLAKEITADGIHLGRDDADIQLAKKTLGDVIIGISCYNDIERAVIAEQGGADYVAFGAFYPSISKPQAPAATLDLLHESRARVTIPVVAIGGITPENGKQLINAHVDFLAVISGLYSASDIINATKAYNKLFITN